MQFIIFVTICLTSVLADVSHLTHHGESNEYHQLEYETTTPQAGPAHPYVFSYQAGRAPGHVDRQHTEVSDGSGVIRGAFSYVDPKNQVRTVQYVADDHGFHPQLSHGLEESAAVKAAKEKHFALYNRIAQEHSAGTNAVNLQSTPPQQSEAVLRATQKHLSLYDRIAAEHAAIGAEHEAQRLAFEATSVSTNAHVEGDDHVNYH